MSVQYYLVAVFSRLSVSAADGGRSPSVKAGQTLRAEGTLECGGLVFQRIVVWNVLDVSAGVVPGSRASNSLASHWNLEQPGKTNVHCCSVVCRASRAGTLALTSKESNWFELENSKKKANPSW